MVIRLAEVRDVPAVMAILEIARRFMVQSGNPRQWTDGYPSQEVILEDIRQGRSYVCEEKGDMVGTFCFQQGIEPNYLRIYDGAWLNDAPYGVIHRLAASGTVKGVAGRCIGWCAARSSDLRADTHRDNVIMQHILEKNGFVKCGTIVVENGTPRIAYQKVSLNHTR